MRFCRSWIQAFVLVGLAGCGGHPSDGAAGGAATPEPASPVPATKVAPGSRAPNASGLVVHEWGTFTAMQGIDGLAVDGLQHEGDALPSFVHAATSPATRSPYHLWGDVSLDVPARHVNSKMETPVVYFYSDVPRQVTVRVDFEGGLLSEWFPRAAISPGSTHGGAVDVADVHRSSLGWDVALTPFAAGPPAAMPEVSNSDPWAFARDVGAAFVTANRDGEAPEVEHYLFYRGLARMRLPLAVQPLDDAGAILMNRGSAPIDGVFLLQIGESDARVVRWEPAVGPGGSAALLAHGEMRPKAEVVGDLSRDVAAMLVAHGLYPDEARAMVRTWATTWFATEGTRVLYVMPRETVDQVLKMSITPAPDRLERVIVARQEFLTPSAKRDVTAALKDRAVPAARDAAMRRLAKLGRFLEPAVRLVAAESKDAAVRASAAEVIAGYGAP